MDPTTTLFTFMLETDPSVQTVSLVGSWDNFTTHHRMDRDSRRDRGQWRGCHTFTDITSDGDRPAIAQGTAKEASRRNGGLRMGQPYYYYYELDGSYETHDTSLPSTSACPYLPGQTLNVMVVPADIPSRKRSASLGSIRYEDFMTMDPGDRFSAPRRAPPPPAIPDFLGPRYRLPTAPQASSSRPNSKHQRSERSLSPGGLPNWWSRKLFTRKQSTSSLRSDTSSATSSSAEEQLSSTASSASSSAAPSRVMSPDSLRRFLSDGTPVSSETEPADRLALSILDEIVEEDDDDEFAVSSAVSEFAPKTALSPPPPRSRHGSAAETMRVLPGNGSAVTLRALQEAQASAFPRNLPSSYTFYQSQQDDEDDRAPISRFSFSSDEGSVFDDDEVDILDSCPSSATNDIPSFYHSDDEDDDDTSCLSPPITFASRRQAYTMGRDSLEQSLAKAFEGYHLPRTSIDGSIHKLPVDTIQASESPALSSPPLLALPTMDDFASNVKSAGLF